MPLRDLITLPDKLFVHSYTLMIDMEQKFLYPAHIGILPKVEYCGAKPPVKLETLLNQWEDVYKKGLLSFWILLLLHQNEMYAYEMTAVIAEISQGTVTVDEKSIYRALKRFEDNQLIQSSLQKSELGPPRRYFRLTEKGRTLLVQFCQRNILIFHTPRVAAAIEDLMSKQ